MNTNQVARRLIKVKEEYFKDTKVYPSYYEPFLNNPPTITGFDFIELYERLKEKENNNKFLGKFEKLLYDSLDDYNKDLINDFYMKEVEKLLMKRKV